MRAVGARVQDFGSGRRGLSAALVFVVALLTSVDAVPQPAPRKPPQALQETGLYSDFAALEVDPRHLAFSPQYPLWTDGAAKRRWNRCRRAAPSTAPIRTPGSF